MQDHRKCHLRLSCTISPKMSLTMVFHSPHERFGKHCSLCQHWDETGRFPTLIYLIDLEELPVCCLLLGELLGGKSPIFNALNSLNHVRRCALTPYTARKGLFYKSKIDRVIARFLCCATDKSGQCNVTQHIIDITSSVYLDFQPLLLCWITSLKMIRLIAAPIILLEQTGYCS